MRQFSVGEVVTWIPDLLLRSETHGDYRIIAAMPDRDGDHMYRIKSPLEEYERVVKEDLLVKSKVFAGRSSKAGFAAKINHTAHAATARVGAYTRLDAESLLKSVNAIIGGCPANRDYRDGQG
jgi:hypothetical protein